MSWNEKTAGVIRTLNGTEHPRNFTSAILAVGGKSERFGGPVTKQMATLLGEPMIAHTVRAFEETFCIHEIVIVARKEEIAKIKKIVKDAGFKKVSAVVEGGPTRQDSVRNGVDAVNPKSKYVAISDGARPLVTPDLIEHVCRAAYKYGGATAAHKCTDTVKTADKKGFIAETTDRDTVWFASTPQVFKTDFYRAAAYTAAWDEVKGTDDCMLMENIGHPVRLVECGSVNLKVTEAEDLVLAEALLRARREKKEAEEAAKIAEKEAKKAEKAKKREEKIEEVKETVKKEVKKKVEEIKEDLL